MKKIVAPLALLLSVCLLVTGCGKSKSSADNTDWADYVTLGTYKGIEVSKPDTTVTDEEIETQVQKDLSSKATNEDITDRPVQTGDVVNIDYVGTQEGVAFTGGTASAQDLTIGSNKYITGFEDGLIGANIGDTVTLNLTFPEDYGSDELAGQDVQFDVTINSIKTVILPELTDEFVAENFDAKTVEEYRTTVKTALETQKATEGENTIAQSVWKQVLDNAEVLNYPTEELQENIDSMKEYYENLAKNANLSFADYVEQQLGTTEDGFETSAKESSQKTLKEKIVARAIAQKENITLTDEEYQTGAEGYMATYNCDTVEEFEEQYGKEAITELLVWEKVVDFLTEQATIQ